MNYPDMRYEIIEAICEYYKSNPDVAVDCLFCLKGIVEDKELPARLVGVAEVAIEQMNYCSTCGEELKPIEYQEHHPELPENPVENIVEYYCPNCDAEKFIKIKHE